MDGALLCRRFAGDPQPIQRGLAALLGETVPGGLPLSPECLQSRRPPKEGGNGEGVARWVGQKEREGAATQAEVDYTRLPL